MSSESSHKGIAEVRGSIHGRVILPGDDEYDAARRLFYGGMDRKPAAIFRVANADDVGRVISLARSTGRELAVRSGGHSLAGHSSSEGGLVLDLSDMRRLDIDPKARSAWAEAGLTA
ncbi:MAG: FAD-binding oxidoreductase, partial [Anaerolineae bacterium]